MLPIRFGTDEEFAALRSLLSTAGYQDATVCERAEVTAVHQVLTSEKRRKLQPPLPDLLDALMWVLMEGRPLDRKSWASIAPEPLADALARFGFVVDQGDDIICPIALYPVENVLVASDRNTDTVDTVYPALLKTTRQFLDAVPRGQCGKFLELCAGTGIAALIAARDFAAHAFAFDIADRSVQYAEFNRRLNGLPNMTNLPGDLYDPAGDTVFDCIVVHPPYVPVVKPRFIFHDGGDDGEQIVKRIVEGLPKHLAPGGHFAMQAMGSDREEGQYEQRARGWLGDSQEDFDVAVVSRTVKDPAEFVAESVMRGKSDSTEIGKFADLFQSKKVNKLVYGTLLIRRKTEKRPAFTVRRQGSKRTLRPAMDWLMDWESSVVSGEADRTVMDSPLHASPLAELRVLSRIQKGDWTPHEYQLQTDYPFGMECETQPWMAYLIGKCDGKTTGRELFRTLVEDQIIFPDTPEDEFARAVTVLVSGGFLYLAA